MTKKERVEYRMVVTRGSKAKGTLRQVRYGKRDLAHAKKDLAEYQTSRWAESEPAHLEMRTTTPWIRIETDLELVVEDPE